MIKLFDTLSKDNFELFAAQNYENLQATEVDEFRDDLNRFKYLKRLLRRYSSSGDLQERLILNHIIVIYNVFGIEEANKMLWFKTDEEHYSVIKPFLIFLHYLPEDVYVEVGMDTDVINALRNL